MNRSLKLAIPLTLGLLVILGGLYAALVAGIFRDEGELTPQAVESKIEAAVEGKSAYYLELSKEEVTALLDDEGDTESQIPEAAEVVVPEMLDKVGDSLRDAGARQIQVIKLEEDKVIIVGVQSQGKKVSDATATGLQEALTNLKQRISPVPPGADIVPPGSSTQQEGDEVYLALGDSLAANTGLTYAENGYVSRFHSYLEREKGKSLGLVNLGVFGESSVSILNSQLPMAVDEIKRRRNDGNPATEVSIVTLDIGANDILTHVGSTRCFEDPAGIICETRIHAALTAFKRNFRQIVSTLASSLERDDEFYVMTVYNPFDFGLGTTYEDFTNEVVETLNVTIRREAEAVGATVADPYPLMKGKAASWTHMLKGDIHPNADGYQALAYSLAQARQLRRGN